MFTGNFINGRSLYVGQNSAVHGIWFNGQYGNSAAWILGDMTSLSNGWAPYGIWAWSQSDVSCPSLINVWQEKWNNNWAYSVTATVECLSGDN